MKNKIGMPLFMLIGFWLFFGRCIFAQQYDTLYSRPNVAIPSEEGSTLIDIIDFPADIIISDLDFYIDMATFGDLPGEFIITVSAPWGKEITLHNHSNKRQFPCWVDTPGEADRPGSLDDFIGHNAKGPWVMYLIRYDGYYPFTWESWAIAAVGEPLAEVEHERNTLVTRIDKYLPSPFAARTNIHFTVTKPEDVSFVIYDALGQIVREFEAASYEPGHHSLMWGGFDSAGASLPSGYYFVKMTVGQMENRQVFTRKLTLLR